MMRTVSLILQFVFDGIIKSLEECRYRQVLNINLCPPCGEGRGEEQNKD